MHETLKEYMRFCYLSLIELSHYLRINTILFRKKLRTKSRHFTHTQTFRSRNKFTRSMPPTLYILYRPISFLFHTTCKFVVGAFVNIISHLFLSQQYCTEDRDSYGRFAVHRISNGSPNVEQHCRCYVNEYIQA